MSDAIKWNLEKVEITKEKVAESLKALQWSDVDPSIVPKDLVWKCLYLKVIALKNYEQGGHWAIETMNLLEFEKNGEVKYGCLGWFVLNSKNPTANLRKAVRMLANHCIRFENHAREIMSTAF